MPVEVMIEDGRWRAVGIEALADRAAEAALLHLGLVPGDWEISVLACDDARIATLNAEFRGSFGRERGRHALAAGTGRGWLSWRCCNNL